VFGISLVYFLLIPLFWIALRLRPRFLTLGFLILGFLGIAGTLFGPRGLTGESLGTLVFQTQLFLIILAVIFYILVAVEEERRVTASLMQSQVTSLANALSVLQGQDRAKTEFIATLAHELRNPLAPVMSTIDFLKLKNPLDREWKEGLAIMDDSIRKVRYLLEDLLDVSRIGEKKLSVDKKVLDLREVAKSAVRSVEVFYRERHQSVSLSLPDSPAYIEGDAMRLEQVVTNLLVNASKFSNTRDRVSLSIEIHESVIELAVTDNGIGIDPLVQKHIFEPFRQEVEDARAKKGVGLGLSLVKSLVELHDGYVRVKSEGKGRGSQFTVLLPKASDAKVAAVRPEDSKEAPLPLKRPRHGSLILIVDDDDAAGAGVGRLLELSGYTVDYAYDGGQAIEKAVRTTPQAVLLDIGLPDMDGYEAARKMRFGGYRGKIIALTGYNFDESRSKSDMQHFTHYLVKPVGLADLKSVL